MTQVGETIHDITMKSDGINISISRGMTGYWYVKIDNKLIAGFLYKDDAKIFAEARFPNAKINEQD